MLSFSLRMFVVRSYWSSSRCSKGDCDIRFSQRLYCWLIRKFMLDIDADAAIKEKRILLFIQFFIKFLLQIP